MGTGSRRVLAIDDDRSILELLRIALQQGGNWIVRCATTPAEALAEAASGVDLIVLDRWLDGWDGLALLHELRAHTPSASVPVVFLTGELRDDELQKLQAAGAAAVLTKPFRIAGLLSRLDELWAARAGREDIE